MLSNFIIKEIKHKLRYNKSYFRNEFVYIYYINNKMKFINIFLL